MTKLTNSEQILFWGSTEMREPRDMEGKNTIKVIHVFKNTVLSLVSLPAL